jgi:hypothetical protein
LPSAGPSSSAAPTAKRKKEKRNEYYGATYLSREEVTELWSLPAQSGGDDQQLPYEFKEAFGIDDNAYAGTGTAASEERAFGSPPLSLPLFEDNEAIVDQEQFGTVDPRLPLVGN